MYKIGMSSQPYSRLAHLRASSPIAIEMLAVIPFIHGREAKRVERYIHKVLAKHRRHSEWFVLTADEVENAVELLRAEASR